MAAKRIKKPAPQAGTSIKSPGERGVNYDQFRPRFSLEHLQSDFCLSLCTQEEKASFADAIHKRSQLTWSQIKNQDRHKLGFEKIARHSLKSPVPMVATDDVEIIAFRFYGMAPMVGFRREATFFILWLDRAFSLYKH